MANEKADMNSTDVQRLKKRIAYLEYKVLPRHKKRVRHHRKPVQTEQARPNNS